MLTDSFPFRLHPEYLFCNPGDKKYQKAQDTINISYCVYDGGEALDGGKKSLKDVVSQQMSFYQAAKPERFSFKIVFDEYKDHTNKPAIVRGVIKCVMPTLFCANCTVCIVRVLLSLSLSLSVWGLYY